MDDGVAEVPMNYRVIYTTQATNHMGEHRSLLEYDNGTYRYKWEENKIGAFLWTRDSIIRDAITWDNYPSFRNDLREMYDFILTYFPEDLITMTMLEMM